MIRGLASLELLGDLLLDVRVLKNAPSVTWKQEPFGCPTNRTRIKRRLWLRVLAMRLGFLL
jgi:hypothetical protein